LPLNRPAWCKLDPVSGHQIFRDRKLEKSQPCFASWPVAWRAPWVLGPTRGGAFGRCRVDWWTDSEFPVTKAFATENSKNHSRVGRTGLGTRISGRSV